jgi:putative effector of murein hydrolase LrgA (UPF0299 family)
MENDAFVSHKGLVQNILTRLTLKFLPFRWLGYLRLCFLPFNGVLVALIRYFHKKTQQFVKIAVNCSTLLHAQTCKLTRTLNRLLTICQTNAFHYTFTPNSI